MRVPRKSLLVGALIAVGCGTEAVVAITSGMSVVVEASGEAVDTAFTLEFTPDTTTHALTAGVASSFTVTEGMYSLHLLGVADNCTVQGDNPRTVEVEAGELVSVTFRVVCTAGGHVKVTVVTTGEDRDDMYTLAFDTDFRTVLVGPNQFVVVSLPVATYSLALRDVASNCTVAGDNPVTVEVTAAAVAETRFSVSCVAR